MNLKKVILFLIFNLTYFNPLFPLPIFGNGGYENIVETYEKALKEINSDNPITDTKTAQDNLAIVKQSLSDIESNAAAEIALLTPLRAFLASKDLYPAAHIYFETEEDKTNAPKYLTEKIAQKKIDLDKIEKEIERAISSQPVKPKQPVKKPELTLEAKLDNAKKSKFYYKSYDDLINKLKSILPTNDPNSLDLINRFIEFIQQDPKNTKDWIIKKRVIQNEINDLNSDEEDWE